MGQVLVLELISPELGWRVDDENISNDLRRHSIGLATTTISLEGAGSFSVLSRFAWYYLYVYCTARSSWSDVGILQ